MKRITIIILLLSAFINGFAQTQIQVGFQDVIGDYPAAPFHYYTYSQNIYHASEINTSGTITALSWYYKGAQPVGLPTMSPITVYIGTTSKTEFNSGIDWINASELTLVYQGNAADNWVEGWNTIALSTPFEYDGSENLVIAFQDNNGGWEAGNRFQNSPTTQNRGLHYTMTINNPDPNNPPNATGLDRIIANIIFHIENNTDCENSIELLPGTTFDENKLANQNNIGRTDSGETPLPNCGNYVTSDTWYKTYVPSNGKLQIEIRGISGPNALSLYAGECGSLTEIICVDNTNTNNTTRIVIDDVNYANQKIYVRVSYQMKMLLP